MLSLTQDFSPDDRALRLSEVRALTGGVSKASIYRWIKAGEFPPPIKISPNRVIWLESEIRGWMSSKVVDRFSKYSINIGELT